MSVTKLNCRLLINHAGVVVKGLSCRCFKDSTKYG